MDIESKSEWLLGYEMRLGEPLGIFECARLVVGHGGRLEDSDQVVRLEFSDLLQIITCRFRKTPCLKPTTGIGVTIVNEHERSQSRLLATGGSRQVPKRWLTISDGKRTFCPLVSKLAGGLM